MNPMESSWARLLEELEAGHGSTVYVVGGPDSGKTTLCNYLRQNLSLGRTVGYLDCDPGQSTLGIPGTLNLEIRDKEVFRIFSRFIGGTSPQHNPLRCVQAIHALKCKAKELTCQYLIVDSSGYVWGNKALEFQMAISEILKPDIVAILQKMDEMETLERILRKRGIKNIFKFKVPEGIQARSVPVRKNIREKKYREYFSQSKLRLIDISNMALLGSVPEKITVQNIRGRLVAFSDKDLFVKALGIARSLYLSDHICLCLTQEFAQAEIDFLELGDMFLSNDFKEEQEGRKP